MAPQAGWVPTGQQFPPLLPSLHPQDQRSFVCGGFTVLPYYLQSRNAPHRPLSFLAMDSGKWLWPGKAPPSLGCAWLDLLWVNSGMAFMQWHVLGFQTLGNGLRIYKPELPGWMENFVNMQECFPFHTFSPSLCRAVCEGILYRKQHLSPALLHHSLSRSLQPLLLHPFFSLVPYPLSPFLCIQAGLQDWTRKMFIIRYKWPIKA